jgi:hypothetical protein
MAGSRLAAGLAAGCVVLALLVLPSGRHVIRPPLYGVPMVLAAAAAVAVSRRPRSWPASVRAARDVGLSPPLRHD